MKHFFYSLIVFACLFTVGSSFVRSASAQEASLTPSPRISTQSAHATLSVTLLLHGIGKAGDSVNKTPAGNMRPLHEQRSIRVSLSDDQKHVVATQEGTVVFDTSEGNFKGAVVLDSNVPNGTYAVSIKADRYMSSMLYDPQVITQGETTVLPKLPLAAGDLNNDDWIDIVDYSILIGCFSDLKPADSCDESTKALGDLTDDGSVNQFDYNLFLRELVES